jgi:light-regulated signal transduction histidine kinase (bacteriophytochrome)
MLLTDVEGGRRSEDLEKRLADMEEENRSCRRELERLNVEREGMMNLHRATLNLLEDVEEERCKYHDAQRALLNILEDVEDERSKVEETKARLETLNKELETFSYSVSHDLRAPLRAIKGLSQAVLEDQSDRLDETGRRYLRLIRDNALRMETLIDDILEFSRLNRQSMRSSEVDLRGIASSVFAELYALERDRDIAFTVGQMPPAEGDEAMLRQVMVNLLSNAIKFTKFKEKATIEFGYEPGENGGSYFVKDNGAGFDPRYADRLFVVFQRLHPAEEYDGTGVGLAVVQRIIVRHGGRVWAEGEIGKGAVFHFTLPSGGTR